MSSEIKNPHDLIFKQCLSDQRIATDFLRQHLPDFLFKKLDIKSLRRCSGSLIDDTLKLSTADVVYEANFGQRQGYIIFLLEHQSTVDRLMPFRMLEYTVKLIRKYIDNDKNLKELPIVYSMVFYQGQKIYDGPTDIFDLFGESVDLAKECMFKPFHLVDLSQIDDEILLSQFLIGAIEFVWKHAQNMDVIELMQRFSDLLLLTKEPWLHKLRLNLLKYILEVNKHTDDQTIERVIQMLPESNGVENRSIADYLRQQGFEKGIEKGIEKGFEKARKEYASLLIALLVEKFGPLSQIERMRIMKAPTEQLMDWTKQVLRAKKLNDIFKKS